MQTIMRKKLKHYLMKIRNKQKAQISAISIQNSRQNAELKSENSKHSSSVFTLRTYGISSSVYELFRAELSVMVNIDRVESCLCKVGIGNAEIFKDSVILREIEIAVLIKIQYGESGNHQVTDALLKHRAVFLCLDRFNHRFFSQQYVIVWSRSLAVTREELENSRLIDVSLINNIPARIPVWSQYSIF